MDIISIVTFPVTVQTAGKRFGSKWESVEMKTLKSVATLSRFIHVLLVYLAGPDV